MRFDKLTTKFQQAFADAQSLANANDNPNIDPVHMVQACLIKMTEVQLHFYLMPVLI